MRGKLRSLSVAPIMVHDTATSAGEATRDAEFPPLRVHHLLLWMTTCGSVITLCKMSAGMSIAAPWSLNGAYFLVNVLAWSLTLAIGVLALWWWVRNQPTLAREIGWLAAIPWFYLWEAPITFLTWMWLAESVLQLSERNVNITVGVGPCALFVSIAVLVIVRSTTSPLWRGFYLVAAVNCSATLISAVAFVLEADLPKWFSLLSGRGRVFVPPLLFAILTVAVWVDGRRGRRAGVFYWAMIISVGTVLLVEPAWVALGRWG